MKKCLRFFLKVHSGDKLHKVVKKFKSYMHTESTCTKGEVIEKEVAIKVSHGAG